MRGNQLWWCGVIGGNLAKYIAPIPWSYARWMFNVRRLWRSPSILLQSTKMWSCNIWVIQAVECCSGSVLIRGTERYAISSTHESNKWARGNVWCEWSAWSGFLFLAIYKNMNRWYCVNGGWWSAVLIHFFGVYSKIYCQFRSFLTKTY